MKWSTTILSIRSRIQLGIKYLEAMKVISSTTCDFFVVSIFTAFVYIPQVHASRIRRSASVNIRFSVDISDLRAGS